MTLIFLAISCITPMTLNLYRKKYEDQKCLLEESCGRGKKKMVGEKFKTAAVITKKASNQHLFSYCVLTIKFHSLHGKCIHGIFSSTQNHNKDCTALPLFHHIQSANITYRVLHKLHICGSCSRITNSLVTPWEWIREQPLEWGNSISNSAPGMTVPVYWGSWQLCDLQAWSHYAVMN